jgi:hypothetical protein
MTDRSGPLERGPLLVQNHFVNIKHRDFNYSYISPERAMQEAVSVIAPAGAMARALSALADRMDLAPLGGSYSSLGRHPFDCAKMLKIVMLGYALAKKICSERAVG